MANNKKVKTVRFTRRSSKWSNRRSLKLLMPAIFILMFAGIGMYLLVSSKAATTSRGAGYNKTGVYPCNGDGAQQVTCYKSMSSWLGRNTSPTIPYVTLMTDGSNPNTMAGNGWGYMVQAGSFQTLSPKPTLVISVPLAFTGTGDCSQSPKVTTCFNKVAAGAYDAQYKQLIQYFIDGGYSNNIIIRLGWEFDGNWMPWSAQNNYNKFKVAYRHVHDLMRSMPGMSGLKFDLCGDSLVYMPTSQMKSIWSKAYPGAGYVDTFGMDVYYSASSYPKFSSYKTAMQAQEAFAKSIGATVSYPEWGQKQKPDTPSFVQGMSDWFASLPTKGAGSLEYQSYFDQDTTSVEGTNGARYLINPYNLKAVAPKSTALFKTLFGGSSTAAASITP